MAVVHLIMGTGLYGYEINDSVVAVKNGRIVGFGGINNTGYLDRLLNKGG